MQGKIVLITGATAGIGQEAARQLAAQGASLVLVGRNEAKCKATAEAIRAEFPTVRVDFIVGDLSKQADVRQVAATYQSRYETLDVLMNNAGGFFMNREETDDGIEYTVALNHLNYFLLTYELLNVLKATPKSRIVNVSSDAHTAARLNPADFEMKSTYQAWRQYSNTKLMNILFTSALAKRLEGTGVTVNCLHPGFVASDFGDNNGKDRGLVGRLITSVWRGVKKMTAISVASGAKTQVYLASSPEVEGVTGKFFAKNKPVRSSAASYDQALSDQLWAWSEAKTGIRYA